MDRRVFGTIGVSVALLAGCGDDGQATSEAAPPADEVLADLTTEGAESLEELYVGVDGDRYIAVGLRGDTAVAYLCDGNEVGRWLEGSVDGDQVTLTDADDTIIGRLDDDELRLDGESGAIVLTPADDDDGLLRLETGGDSIGGLVIVDGTSRGRMLVEARTSGIATFTVVAGTEPGSALLVESAPAQINQESSQLLAVMAERETELREADGAEVDLEDLQGDLNDLRAQLRQQLAELALARDDALADLAAQLERALQQLAAQSATAEQVAALERIYDQVLTALEQEYARLVAEIQAMLDAIDAQVGRIRPVIAP